MTYAYLKKYSPRTDKTGYYIDGPNWTLQTSFRADRFFRQSKRYHDDTELPLTVVKAMIHLGEATTGGRKSRETMLRWFPQLNPSFCEMSSKQMAELRDFVTERIEAGDYSGNDLDRPDDFVSTETSLDIDIGD